MHFIKFAATFMVALSSFAAALPSAEANGLAAAEDALGNPLFAIEKRQCRRVGARCRRDRQCCSGECDDGRCERDSDDDD